MSRISLAFSAFFRLITGRSLPPEAAAYLPATEQPKGQPTTRPKELPEAKPDAKADAKPEAKPDAKGDAKGDAKPDAKADPKPDAKADAKTPKADGGSAADKTPRAEDRKPSAAAHHRDGALALLALLQREGRLVDFLREPLDGFSDADIGAAARDVHRGCRKVLEQHLTLEPVMPGAEEDKVTVPKGFDPAEVRLVGEARGEAPYRGTLRHHGWRATSVKLPTLTEGVDRAVLAPAEVELGS